MALVSCPGCATRVSSLSLSCPRCGRSFLNGDGAGSQEGTLAAAVPQYFPAEAAPALPRDMPQWASEAEAVALHPMSLGKLVVMSLCTFGFYEVYWFYRNWYLQKAFRKEDVSPFWRAIFAPLFGFSMFRNVRNQAERDRLRVGWSAGGMGLLFLVLSGLSRLPDPYWLVCLLSFAPILPVQRTINELNAASPRPAPVNAEFSVLNLAGIAVGGLCLFLAVIGTLFPEG